MKSRVLSGVQPTGNLHIGNYLGALKNWVAMQHNYDCIFCIVDLHAITAYQAPDELRAKIRELAGIYLAAGIDPKHSSIIVQSQVAGHSELAWMLTCVTPVGWLYRMTQFKAKSAEKNKNLEMGPLLGDNSKIPPFDKNTLVKEAKRVQSGEFPDAETAIEVLRRDSIGDGLLQYPVLMAADILLYQAAIVPVGEDQSQHLELARDIAQRFNSLYGETFTMPATKLPAVGARIMGLDEPEKKMSKSAPGSNHAVAILDPPDLIRKKIMRATTDSLPGVDVESPGPGVQNLLGIYQAFSGWSTDQMKSHFAGMRYGDLKKQVAEMVASSLEPIQKRYQEITADPAYLDRILEEGASRVTPIAEDTVRLVKERMGLYVRK